jgi:hypothetical protein
MAEYIVEIALLVELHKIGTRSILDVIRSATFAQKPLRERGFVGWTVSRPSLFLLLLPYPLSLLE